MKTPALCGLATALLFSGVSLTPRASGATVSLTPAMDTSLMEIAADNNTGAMVNLVSGTVANGKKTRCLFQFDVAKMIPEGAAIDSVSLRLTVLKAPPGTVSPGSRFGLHRILVPWIEGSKGGSNTGDRATDGEPTWFMRSLNGVPWSEPGGALGDDFATATSGSIDVDLPKDYLLSSSPAMVSDVQSWLCHPDSNFGWVLISDREDLSSTARRFGSRESAANQIPTLTVEYSVPSPEIKILEARLNGGLLALKWSGSAASFQVQQRTTWDGDWVYVGDPVGCERSAELPAQQKAAFLRVISR